MRSTEKIMEKMDVALDGHTLRDCIDALVGFLVVSILEVHDTVDERLIEQITNHMVDVVKDPGSKAHAKNN